MVQTRQPNIERAKSIVEREIELVTTEREAFDRFRSRLRDITPSTPEVAGRSTGPASATALVASRSGPTPGMTAIRTAYRETVMDVPHYDSEYGETLRDSLRAEFGTQLASHVVDGQALVPAIHEALLEASAAARDDREDYCYLLERERDSLRSIESDLDDIEPRTIDLHERITAADESSQLASIDATLQTLETACTELANERQQVIHNRKTQMLSGIEESSLVRYLYGSCESIFPALTDISACLDSVRHERTRCLR